MNRKKKIWYVLILFLGGIAVGASAALWQREWLEEQMAGYQFRLRLQIIGDGAYEKVWLMHLLRVRVPKLLLLLAASRFPWFLRLLAVLTAAAGTWIGVLVCALVMGFGWRGISLFLMFLVPQYLLYGFGCVLLSELHRKRRLFTAWQSALLAVQISLVFVVGVAAEWMIGLCWGL